LTKRRITGIYVELTIYDISRGLNWGRFSADYNLPYFKAKYNNEGSSGIRVLGGVICDRRV
jgi:hypothetical protein